MPADGLAADSMFTIFFDANERYATPYCSLCSLRGQPRRLSLHTRKIAAT